MKLFKKKLLSLLLFEFDNTDDTLALIVHCIQTSSED